MTSQDEKINQLFDVSKETATRMKIEYRAAREQAAQFSTPEEAEAGVWDRGVGLSEFVTQMPRLVLEATAMHLLAQTVLAEDKLAALEQAGEEIKQALFGMLKPENK